METGESREAWVHTTVWLLQRSPSMCVQAHFWGPETSSPGSGVTLCDSYSQTYDFCLAVLEWGVSCLNLWAFLRWKIAPEYVSGCAVWYLKRCSSLIKITLQSTNHHLRWFSVYNQSDQLYLLTALNTINVEFCIYLWPSYTQHCSILILMSETCSIEYRPEVGNSHLLILN